jgi:hypothetical protein
VTTTQLVITILAFFIFLAIAMFCIARPSAVQQHVLKFYEHRERAQKLNPFWTWMQGRSYVVSIRLSGVVAVLMALGILWALVLRFK